MIQLGDIHALDHFKRNTTRFRARLKRSGRPEVLTVDGKAELIVQSADGYQRLLDRLEELETLAGLREGLSDAGAGRVVPADRVFGALRGGARGSSRRTRRPRKS